MKTLYLSGAPRVSIKAISGCQGPRAHVLGVIGGFKQLGYSVDQLIIGDHVPEKMITANFEPQKEVSKIKQTIMLIMTDLVRLFIRFLIIWKGKLRRVSNRHDLVYERYGLFMGLGNLFKKPKGIWILESNAVLSQESSGDRTTVFFTKWAKKSEKKAYHNCDYLIVVTEALKTLIIDVFEVPADKIIVVPNGVDSQRFNPNIKTEKRQISTKFVLGFVGNLIAWQHLELPIRVVNKLRKEGIDIGMVIVGDGAEREDLQGLIEELDAQNHVILAGSADWKDVPAYINGFDACYSGPLPLTSGKMYLSPLKLYEYLAMDKPVVASNYADAEELLTGEWASYLFKQNDEQSLTTLLRKLVTKEIAEDFSPLGNKVRVHLSWTGKVQRLLETVGAI